MSETRLQRRRRNRWYSPVSLARGLWARPKLILAVAAAVTTLMLLPPHQPWSLRATAAWNAGAMVYLAGAFWIMSACTSDIIRRKAEQEDESRFVFLAVIMLATASSFTALVDLLAHAKGASGIEKAIDLGLAGLTILSSWLVMQIVFTLHYAHDYYGPSEHADGIARGLKFPEDEAPDYWDFFYFTTSIGATSQTSDVAITAKRIRRLVAMQAVLSFVFNTSILALAINLAAGMI